MRIGQFADDTLDPLNIVFRFKFVLICVLSAFGLASGNLDLENIFVDQRRANVVLLALELFEEIVVQLSYNLNHQEVFHNFNDNRLENDDVETDDGDNGDDGNLD